MNEKEIRIRPLISMAIFCAILFFLPPPNGLSAEAWKLFAIFLFTIGGIILKAAPMGVMSMLGITCVALSSVVAAGNAKKAIEITLSGFSNSVIWLIVLSFFISRGFIKTGLGSRIAYIFLMHFGRTPLGIAYSLNFADLVLAPAIPSNTARGGGIIYPVMKSICLGLDSHPGVDKSRKKIGAFLNLVVYNGNLITSAMFLTATAGNPLAQKFAQDLGISLTWGQWALAGLVPGLLTLLIMPLFLYRFYRPTIKDTQDTPQRAKEKLQELGSMKAAEWIMLACFFIVLLLWIFGDQLGVEATTTGFLGLSFLLVTSVLSWEDIKAEKGAWDTLVWFAALVMMGSQLNALGFIPWLTSQLEGGLSHLSWNIAFPLIVLAYCYSHYLFASATAHVASMYGAFLSLGISLGVPGKLLALMLGMMTSLMGTQTHYGHGPAPVFFGSGYTDLKEWWGYGFVLSVMYILIFMGVGAFWWRAIQIF